MDELLDRLGLDRLDLERAVKDDLAAMGVAFDGFRLKSMPGGASIRGYARISLCGDHDGTMVLMLLSDPDPAKGVEEVMAKGVIRELPFINVHRHLKSSGISVPDIRHYNRERGLIYLEDLGDRHLRQEVESGDREAARSAFQAAIRELVKIQVDATAHKNENFLGFMVKFDRGLLTWELDHFTEHAIRRRVAGAPSAEDEAKINERFESIASELLAGPYALQHRDYHMDNLLIVNGRIKVIDFQDALMGPLAYDLACLLYDRDTSFLLGADLIEELVDYYAASHDRRSGGLLDRALFRRNFELCVIHRLLKVVGRFHYIDQVKKRPEYLRFIPYMIGPLKDYLSRGARRLELLEIIASYLPEFRDRP